MLQKIILIILIYICYKTVKSWLSSISDSSKTKVYYDGKEKIDDVMLKDPFCEVYFPEREGVHLNHEGEDLIFCSTECRDKFLESLN